MQDVSLASASSHRDQLSTDASGQSTNSAVSWSSRNANMATVSEWIIETSSDIAISSPAPGVETMISPLQPTHSHPFEGHNTRSESAANPSIPPGNEDANSYHKRNMIVREDNHRQVTETHAASETGIRPVHTLTLKSNEGPLFPFIIHPSIWLPSISYVTIPPIGASSSLSSPIITGSSSVQETPTGHQWPSFTTPKTTSGVMSKTTQAMSSATPTSTVAYSFGSFNSTRTDSMEPTSTSPSLAKVAWTPPAACASYAQYPTMYYGMDMNQFRIDEQNWANTMEGQTIDLNLWSECTPQFDLIENMKIANVSYYPNQGKELPVKGLEANKVLWFTETENRTRSDPVVLYIHGGGLFWGILPYHAAALDQILSTINVPRLSWLSVDYTLTMYKKYPQQLRELVAVYTELLKTTDNIIIVSDSSGAHEAVELLIHMQSPFPTIDPVPENNATKALLMASPWMDYSGYSDIIWLYNAGINIFGTWWQNTSHTPSQDTTIKWDKVIPPKTFLVYGEDDTVLDQVNSFRENAGSSIDDSNVYEEPQGVHDGWVILGNQTVADHIADFIKSVI